MNIFIFEPYSFKTYFNVFILIICFLTNLINIYRSYYWFNLSFLGTFRQLSICNHWIMKTNWSFCKWHNTFQQCSTMNKQTSSWPSELDASEIFCDGRIKFNSIRSISTVNHQSTLLTNWTTQWILHRNMCCCI